MHLKNALAAISRFTDPKPSPNGSHTVRLSRGQVVATNTHSGCRIPVEASTLDVEGVVCFRDLRKIVSALDSVTLAVKRKTLHIEGGGSKFKLKCFPTANLLTYPEEPTADQWKPVSGRVLAALASLTEVIEAAADSTNGLASLRITPTWAATATQAMIVALHAELGVDEPVSVSPAAVAGLGTSEGGAVCVTRDKLWVRDDATGQVRWAQALATPWPDSIVESMLPTTIAAPGRVSASTDLAEFKALSDRARLLMTGDEYGRLTTDSGAGVLTIDGTFARGSFVGTVATEIDDSTEPVGVSPMRLSTILDVVGSPAIMAAFGSSVDLSFGGDNAPPQPLVLKLGPMEALLMPVVLP